MTSSAEAEALFCRDVMILAQRMGLLAHWCPDSRKCVGDKGFPDLVIIGPGGILFAECKMPDAMTSAEQDQWLWMIGQATGNPSEARIWFPYHLENGTIEKELEPLS